MAADDDVEVTFGASVTDLVNAVNGVKEKVESVIQPVKDLEGGFRDLRLAVYDAFAVEKVAEFVDRIAELGEATVRMADEFGITTEQVGQLNAVAKLTGTGSTQLATAFEQLERGLVEAQRGTSQQTAALKALGLTTKDLIGLPLPQQLDIIANKFSQYADGTNKMTVATSLLGRSALAMIPFLDKGAAGVKELADQAKITGDVLTTEMAERFEETQQHINEFGMAMEGLGIRIFNAIQPIVDASVKWGTQLVESLNADTIKNDAIDIANALISIFTTIGDYSLETAKAIQDVTGPLQNLVNLFKTDSKATIGLPAVTFLQGPNAGMTENGGGGPLSPVVKQTASDVVDFDALQKKFDASAKAMGESINTLLGANHPATVGDRAAELADKLGSGKPQLSPVTLAGAGAAADPFQTIIGSVDKEITALKSQVAVFGMSTQAAAQYTEEQKLLAEAQAKNISLTPTETAEIHAKAVAYGQATEAAQQLKDQQSAINDLAQIGVSAFMEFIDGTKSLGDAMLDLAANIADAVIEAVLLDAVLDVVTGGTAAAAGTGGIGGALSGFVGSALGFGGGKAGGGPLDMGKWYIAGEKGPEPIWGGGPGAFAQGYSGGSQQSQPPINFTYAPSVQAMDQSGVMAVLNKHGAIIAKTIGKLQSSNPSLRPGY